MADGGSDMARVIDAEFVVAEQPEAANPLFDRGAECGVIAAVMIDEGGARGVWRKLSALLTAAHFHEPRNAALWSAFEALSERGEPIDIITIGAELKARRRMNLVGAQYLDEVATYLPTSAHCEAHAALVLDCFARRALVEIGSRLARAAADGTRAPMQLRDLAVETLRRVDLGGGAAAPSSATQLLTELWSTIEDGIAGKNPGPLPFSVPTLDRMSGGGMKHGGTYFLAARPGIGKTAMACQVSGATAERGERVLYVALEPKRLDVIQSIVANRAGVALEKIARTPQLLSQNDMHAIAATANAVDGWPIHVVDVTELSCPNTVAKVEAAMRALPTMPALVVIDHLLELMPVGRHEKEHHGVAQVVAGLISLGKRTGATILCLAHIGRAMSGTGNLFRRPRTEDIAGGDAINRSADGIILLHREDKYPTKKDSIGNKSLAGVVDILAPKLRGAEDNTFGRMRYRGELQRFEAIDDETAPDTEVGGMEGDGYA